MQEAIVIRRATERDGAAVTRLADLDSRPVPRGELLLAAVDGELRAALPLAGGELVADPFKPTEPLAALLRLRATQDWVRTHTPRSAVFLALRLSFRAPDRTLTDDEVAERREAITSALAEELGGRVRAA